MEWEIVRVPITLFRYWLVNLFLNKIQNRVKKRKEATWVRSDEEKQHRTGEKKFKYTKTKIHFFISGVLGCWRI